MYYNIIDSKTHHIIESNIPDHTTASELLTALVVEGENNGRKMIIVEVKLKER